MRGRFAPSPTGTLHLGNLRTALLAWLFARAAGSEFLVRMEDLDPGRVRPEAAEQQLADLAAIGLDWDGEVLFQSARMDLYADALAEINGPMIHAEEAETSLALALGQRVLMDLASRDAWDRGHAVRQAGLPWTSFGQYGMRHAGPKVVVPMDMLRDISPSGVVGDATRARRETGERIISALVPRIVQVCLEMAGKE